MKKFALIALPLAFGLVACDNSATDTVDEPVGTEMATEPMATETMTTDTMDEPPMGDEVIMEDGMMDETTMNQPAPEATETPM
jgi:hypothetical protein